MDTAKFNEFLEKLKTAETTTLIETIEDGYNTVFNDESTQELANKHNVDVDIIEDQLKQGIDVESEHTDDVTTATSIAKRSP